METISELFFLENISLSIINQSDIQNTKMNIYEQPVSRNLRVAVLAVLAVLGGVGNLAVLLWILCNLRTHRWTRFLSIFLQLTVSDMMVILCATTPQIFWDYGSRDWVAGDFLCRLFKFLQTFSICSSNYLTVVIAVDRWRAIEKPLSLTKWKVTFLCGGSWVVAAIVNSPILVLFKESQHNGQIVCRNVLYDSPVVVLRIYLTAVVVLVFVAPLVVISVCYLQIFRKISKKASQGIPSGFSSPRKHNFHLTDFNNKRQFDRRSKISLKRAANNSLSRAKIKTLKMTLAIITSFLVCSAPYCIVEMWRVYGDYQSIGATTYSILAALAVSNSSTNPIVFLVFHFGSGQKQPVHRGQTECVLLQDYCSCCCKSWNSHREYDSSWGSELKDTLSSGELVQERAATALMPIPTRSKMVSFTSTPATCASSNNRQSSSGHSTSPRYL